MWDQIGVSGINGELSIIIEISKRAARRCNNHPPKGYIRVATNGTVPGTMSSMKMLRLFTTETQFVDTPEGIFTSSGVWFRTRVALLEDYAGAVFTHEPLPMVLTHAEVWLRSAQTLALWVLPAFLFIASPVQAGLGTLVVYVAWRGLGPSFVNRPMMRLFGVMDLVLVQALYYVFVLSTLAAQAQYSAVWAGLAGFVLLRWGLIRWSTAPLLRPIWRSLYTLPVPDQVLRATLVRAAMKFGVSLPEIDRMERQILDNLHRKKSTK